MDEPFEGDPTPGYAHIILDEEELDTIFSVDMPTEEYYDALRADMRKRFDNQRLDPSI